MPLFASIGQALQVFRTVAYARGGGVRGSEPAPLKIISVYILDLMVELHKCKSTLPLILRAN